MVYAVATPKLRMDGPLIDRARRVQFSGHYACFYPPSSAIMIHESVPRDPGSGTSLYGARSTHAWWTKIAQKKSTYASSRRSRVVLFMFVFSIAACAPWDLLKTIPSTIYFNHMGSCISYVCSPSPPPSPQHVAHVFPFQMMAFS